MTNPRSEWAPAGILAPIAALLLFLGGGCAEQESQQTGADTLRDGVPAEVDTIGSSQESILSRPDRSELDGAGAPTSSIYSRLRQDGRFSTFVDAVARTGLDQTLSDTGPYTVFAPTDDAFARREREMQHLLRPENEDLLMDLLLSHMTNGEVRYGSLQSEPILSLSGYDVVVERTDGSVELNGASVVEYDLLASNGVIHVVDDVFVPDEE